VVTVKLQAQVLEDIKVNTQCPFTNSFPAPEFITKPAVEVVVFVVPAVNED
jgi:hypothetical protein